MASISTHDKVAVAIDFAHQAEKLSLRPRDSQDSAETTAIEAKFITPQDVVIETANGGRLPGVPLEEAHKLNLLKDQVENPIKDHDNVISQAENHKKAKIGKAFPDSDKDEPEGIVNMFKRSPRKKGGLHSAAPPSKTDPLFPPLPLYGPPSLLRNLQCMGFRISSFFLSLGFLGVVVLGSLFTTIPLMLRNIGCRLLLKDPAANRPFYEEENRRRKLRQEAERQWTRTKKKRRTSLIGQEDNEEAGEWEDYEPLEGGKDALLCNVAYYARRVGLDAETFKVQTEDGFLLELWHIYNPKEYTPVSAAHRAPKSPEVFVPYKDQNNQPVGGSAAQYSDGNRKYPVLLIHGLLQSAGTYCTNDDDSLAFFLCKSGYDVWLGNNRCGFHPEHTMLNYSDPRMWAWNIRQMGVLDLPALISRVLFETGFEKLGLVCHSQGTTQTFVALAKEQRPDLGEKISVFCALAPAAYAGPLIGKMYFKFMRVISPAMFRIFFGIHSFIPFMMTMHALLPAKLYGALGYRVFSFLFNWTDARWERDLRPRFFQFAPVYVSAESMRWWLGRECFAKQKCILATREEAKLEDFEDSMDDCHESPTRFNRAERGRTAWYNEQAPPMAMWIAGSDGLVDGRRLLRRFHKGREPNVHLVHAKVIDEYEHLDVVWAIDVIDQIGKELREVVWKTVSPSVRALCRTPKECQDVGFLEPWSPSSGSEPLSPLSDD
ncbi:MAG: hypothetical protein M1834_004864 [Cirrosporium novae-zelandiae]|nr:MAG: hypothetical protein M1834_004864 [Cirrosporium novae-zelandiae]